MYHTTGSLNALSIFLLLIKIKNIAFLTCLVLFLVYVCLMRPVEKKVNDKAAGILFYSIAAKYYFTLRSAS